MADAVFTTPRSLRDIFDAFNRRPSDPAVTGASASRYGFPPGSHLAYVAVEVGVLVDRETHVHCVAKYRATGQPDETLLLYGSAFSSDRYREFADTCGTCGGGDLSRRAHVRLESVVVAAKAVDEFGDLEEEEILRWDLGAGAPVCANRAAAIRFRSAFVPPELERWMLASVGAHAVVARRVHTGDVERVASLCDEEVVRSGVDRLLLRNFDELHATVRDEVLATAGVPDPYQGRAAVAAAAAWVAGRSTAHFRPVYDQLVSAGGSAVALETWTYPIAFSACIDDMDSETESDATSGVAVAVAVVASWIVAHAFASVFLVSVEDQKLPLATL